MERSARDHCPESLPRSRLPTRQRQSTPWRKGFASLSSKSRPRRARDGAGGGKGLRDHPAPAAAHLERVRTTPAPDVKHSTEGPPAPPPGPAPHSSSPFPAPNPQRGGGGGVLLSQPGFGCTRILPRQKGDKADSLRPPLGKGKEWTWNEGKWIPNPWNSGPACPVFRLPVQDASPLYSSLHIG